MSERPTRPFSDVIIDKSQVENNVDPRSREVILLFDSEMADERPTPRDEDIPGGVPVTPSVNSITQRETSLIDNLRPASFGALTFEPQQQHAPILDRNSSSSIVLPRGESTEEKRKSANDPHRLPTSRSSMFAPGVPDIMREFETSNRNIATFVVSVYVLGFAFGLLLAAPLSEIYGRAIVFNIANVLFLVMTVATALS
ncbi:hypothetical protein FocTR4_00017151 [Fusarium oxysporum f. sp. cubense]|uniref:Major facilitator superfamily (MFS) profile domain-containing protein n=1 Tax=Fusarium oxysporum f. sp. cubense TaxID=61366 RepID=A0A5C6SGX4_FUSOC|nr:hypothetical protein FocTR4_00017151 [Fusarium oxysporum f. sp. cubense]